jgi:hypothetical protein
MNGRVILRTDFMCTGTGAMKNLSKIKFQVNSNIHLSLIVIVPCRPVVSNDHEINNTTAIAK